MFSQDYLRIMHEMISGMKIHESAVKPHTETSCNMALNQALWTRHVGRKKGDVYL